MGCNTSSPASSPHSLVPPDIHENNGPNKVNGRSTFKNRDPVIRISPVSSVVDGDGAGRPARVDIRDFSRVRPKTGRGLIS